MKEFERLQALSPVRDVECRSLIYLCVATTSAKWLFITEHCSAAHRVLRLLCVWRRPDPINQRMHELFHPICNPAVAPAHLCTELRYLAHSLAPANPIASSFTAHIISRCILQPHACTHDAIVSFISRDPSRRSRNVHEAAGRLAKCEEMNCRK